MAEYVFTPSGTRVQSPTELPAPLWAKAPAPKAADAPKRRTALGAGGAAKQKG